MSGPPPPTERPPRLLVEGVSKTFRTASGRLTALQDINVQIDQAESVSCLVGPSGSGKSTLLAIIAGLETPDAGQVLVDGKPVEGPGRERMVMFQEPALFPWLNVLDNVLFGLKLKPGVTARQRREVAEYYLEMVGLAKFHRANIHELSGGMKQRVALARSLAPNPAILLMDEPFAALDAMTREQIYADVQQIWQKQRKTVVFVTHNTREAICLGDRVLLMSASPGRIIEEFAIEMERPRDINSIEVARHAIEIKGALKKHNQEARENS